MQQEHIIVVIMPCVTTPREDTIVPARKVSLGMEKTVQVTLLPFPWLVGWLVSCLVGWSVGRSVVSRKLID